MTLLATNPLLFISLWVLAIVALTTAALCAIGLIAQCKWKVRVVEENELRKAAM